MSAKDIMEGYDRLKRLGQSDLSSYKVRATIVDVANASLAYLSDKCEITDLVSKVPSKRYFSFSQGNRLSRPINRDLFDRDVYWECIKAFKDQRLEKLSGPEITRLLYVATIAFCAFINIRSPGNQKTPGTYFEYLIGHVFSHELGVNPQNSIQVLNQDESAIIPTDFVFDLGPNQSKFHLPVKTSTRERVVQVWAHQRVLDGVYGTGRYKGILVALNETKLNRRNLEVLEICLPNQWKIYQMFIARLERVYYLDMPEQYAKLGSGYPRIDVKEIGAFYSEKKALIGHAL